MADRTVKVVLKADIGSYVKDVAVATAATRALRQEAERFEGRYNATLTVNDRASGSIRKAEQSLQKMAKASGGLQGQLADLRKELAGLENGGAKSARAEGIVALNKRIEQVKSNLASLNNQKITIPVASEITKGNIELADLQRRLELLGKAKFTPEVDLRLDQLRRSIATGEREVREMAARLADEKLQINPGEFVTRLRKQVAAAAASLPEIPLRADSSPIDREIVRIREELIALSKVRAQNADAAARRATQLQESLRRISGSSASASVRIDTESAALELGRIEKQSARTGRAVSKLSANARASGHSMLYLARQAADSARALRTLAIAPLAVGSIPALSSLTTTVSALGGALATLPAVSFAAGAGLAVIGIGLKNWADFSKELGKGKMGKAAKEAEKMAPAARETALALIERSAAYDTAAEAVQQELFKNSKRELGELADVYLPIIAKSLGGIAGEMNRAAVAFSNFATRADTVKDAKDGLELIRQAAERIAPIWVNLSRVMRDTGAVGARLLPEMAQGMENMTARWADAVANARASGSLQAWMREGMQEMRQLGRIAVDTGGILAGIGRAAEAAGIDTVASIERMTDAGHRWIDSWQGQAQVSSFLSGLRSDVESFLPGLRDLAAVAFEFIQHMSGSGTLQAAGEAFSSLAEAARPTAEVLGQLTASVLKPLLGTVELLSPALGPLIAGMLSFRLASKGIDKVQGALTNVGGKFDSAARAASGNAAATSRVAGALGRVSGALPLVGIALLGVAGGYEALRDRSEEAATSVLNGSQTLEQAYQQEFEALGRRKSALEFGTLQTVLFGTGQQKAALIADTYTEAVARTNEKLRDQIAAMPPLQAAQATVTLRQRELTEATRLYGAASPQAKTAQNQLTAAMREAELQQYANRIGVDLHTASLIRNKDQLLAASDAEIGYFAAVDRASQSVAENGRTLDVHTAAGRANQTALNDLTRAAFADIAAKKEQGASTDDITRRTSDHANQLYDTMIQMGRSKEEAGLYIAKLGLVPPEQTTKFLTPGLKESIDGVNEFNRLVNDLLRQGPVRVGAEVGAAFSFGAGRAAGGPISGPGGPTDDRIPTMLSDGEYVIKASSAQKLGRARLDALNAGVDPIHRASGGPVNREVSVDFRQVASFIKNKTTEAFPPMPAGGWGGGGAQQWAGVALQALAMLGQPASLLPRVLQQIQIESSGNPRAINLWDINARRGTPSMGLIQTIMPTYLDYADPRRNLGPYDPLSNLLAGMRYAIARYGSIAAIWPKTWGYHDGGVVPGTGGGDNKLIRAQAGERVLTRPQNRDFERLVDVLERPTPISPYLAANVRGGDGPGAHVEIHNENHFVEAVDLDLFNQRQDFAVRAISF